MPYAKEALVEINQYKPILETTETGLTKMSGIASEVEVKNGNGRIYPYAVMERAVNAAQTMIDEGSFNGELDHPEFGYRGKLKNTAMRFTRLYMEGNLVKFDAVLLETSEGQQLKALLNGGVKVGMSTRGAGTLVVEESDDGEILKVGEDFELFGIDAVDIPSSKVGILKLQESIEEKINEQKGYTMAKEIKTVADLEEQYGPLVGEIKETAKTEAIEALQEGQTQKQVELDAANARIATLEGELAEAQKSVEAMTEVKKAVLGEAAADKRVGDDVVAGKVESMLEDLKTELQAARQESKELKESIAAEKNKAQLQSDLKDLFEVEVKDDKHEKILRKHIDPTIYESTDALKKKIQEYRTVFADLPTVTESLNDEGKPKGKGVVESDNGNDEKAITEEERRQRILSGLPLNG